jgi:4-hydroxyphenylacetate 3-monooxygenase
MEFVRHAAGLSDRVMGETTRTAGDSAISRWFDTQVMLKAAE